MKRFQPLIRRYGKAIVAIAIIIGLFWWTQLPVISAAEKEAIASRFGFTRLQLPEIAGKPFKFIREVHPSLARHSGWISAVGAAVALNDLDGDGLPNDVCYVEPRQDQVIVAPVPGTGDRYQPFNLEVTSFNYDRATMAPMGCLPGDLNEDGLMDLLVYYWGRTPVAFLKQENNVLLADNSYFPQEIVHNVIPPTPLGKGGNQAISQNAIPPNPPYEGGNWKIQNSEKWYTNAATFADLDGDGHNDLIIGNYFQDGAEILNVKATGSEKMQHSMSRANNGGKNRIFRWVGATAGANPSVELQEVEGVFNEAIAQGWTLGVGTADLDGDLLPEIYFANDFGSDRLLHNRSTPGKLKFALLEGQKGLTTPNSKVLGHDSYKGMGVDFGDVNHDGLLDIYVIDNSP